MSNKISLSIIAGLIATAVMTLVMFIAPMMGMPKMNPPAMLSMVMGFPLVLGWMAHFMIGVIFALSYTFIFSKLLQKIESNVFKGVVFGLIAFAWAQISMKMMGLVFMMPPMPGSVVLNLMGSMLGHIVFGIVVSLVLAKATAKVSVKTV